MSARQIEARVRYSPEGNIALWFTGYDHHRYFDTREDLYAHLANSSLVRGVAILLRSLDAAGDEQFAEVFTPSGAVVPYFDPLMDADDLPAREEPVIPAPPAPEPEPEPEPLLPPPPAPEPVVVLPPPPLPEPEPEPVEDPQEAERRAQARRDRAMDLVQSQSRALAEAAEQRRLEREEAERRAAAQVVMEPERPENWSRPETFVPLDSAKEPTVGPTETP